MVVRVLTVFAVASSVHAVEEEDSSLLQYKSDVQLGSVRDVGQDDLDCMRSGKCKPVTKATTTEAATTTTTAEFFVKKDTCDRFSCPDSMLALPKEELPEDCGDDACTSELCCMQKDTCGGFSCPNGMLALPDDKLPENCGDKECTPQDCCVKEDTCDGHKCPKDHHLSTGGLCGKLKCSSEDCCEKKTDCDGFTCTTELPFAKPKPPENCGGPECKAGQCCVGEGTCGAVKCGEGFHSTSTEGCGKAVCSEADCCAKNQACDAFVCKEGFTSVSRDTCESKTCTSEECCQENPSCGDFSCPKGFFTASKAVCAEAKCKKDECCEENPSCGDYSCPDDFHRTNSETCSSSECSSKECCAPNQKCGDKDFKCAPGFHALDDAPDVCGQKDCEQEECCGENPTCELHDCPTGFHSSSTAVCKGKECSTGECCKKNPTCADYECPDHHISSSKDTCAGETCTTTECCEKTTTTTTAQFVYCDSYKCPKGFEKNMRRDACDDKKCSSDQCCDKIVPTTTTTTTKKVPPAPPPPPAPCGAFTCPAGQRNMCGRGGHQMLSRFKPVHGRCDSHWGRFRSINDGSHNHWHACDNVRHDTWLVMDLQGEYAISSMSLTQGSHSNYGYRRLEIQRSVNGHNWYHVRTDYNGQCGSGVRKQHSGWREPTRFVKVKFHDMCGGNHYAFRDWSIYGEKYNGCTADKCCQKIPPKPKPSCLMYQCPAGYMRSSTRICQSGTCSTDECCEKGAPVGARMHCRVWGDPHVQTFDGVYAERLGQDLFLPGDFYLVKAPNIQMQGRLTYSAWPKTSTGEIMVQGDALRGKLLNIKWDGTVRWGNQNVHGHHNDEVISISGGRVHFKDDPTVDFTYRAQRAGRSGLLELNIYMNQRSGVGGFCGNMNGNQRDDGQFVNHRASQVPGHENLWGKPMVVAWKPPEKKCEGLLKQKAEKFCILKMGGPKKVDRRSDKFASCIFDHCMGGEKLAIEGLDFLNDAKEDDDDDDKGKGKGKPNILGHIKDKLDNVHGAIKDAKDKHDAVKNDIKGKVKDKVKGLFGHLR